MGALAEHFADEKGLVWPENVAPAKVYLARLSEEKEVAKVADDMYDSLSRVGVSVLYDDRDLRPGEKFADAELMGIPYRVVVSKKTVESGKHELKGRTDAETVLLSAEEIITKLSS